MLFRSLEKAISFAASKAGLKSDEYGLVAFPKKVNPIEKFLSNARSDLESKLLREKIGGQAKMLQALQYLIRVKGVQARLPFETLIY